MTDKPSSPFAGLDKALLRSTQRPMPTAVEPQASSTVPSADADKVVQVPETDESASYQAIKLASSLAERDVIELIRKAVKVPGKEVSFVRLTAEEKGQLAEIVYTYKRQGKKTSENEINRIAINFILEDYKAQGENSILASVLASLLA